MMGRAAFTLIELLVVLAIITFLLACVGFGLPLDYGFSLIFGWAVFLWDVVPRIRVDYGGLATAGVCMALLAFGTHRFLGWFYGHLGREGDPDSSEGRPWPAKWTATLVGGIVVMFVAGIATAGLAHQVGWLVTSKEPVTMSSGVVVQRMISVNNLKHIGLGLHNYHGTHSVFPAGGTFDGLGRPMHSWQTALLPFLEESALYDRIDFGVSWDHPANAKAFSTEIPAFLHPGHRRSEPGAGYAPSHYSGNALVLGGDAPRGIEHITDGLSSTIHAGEAAARFRPWGDPANWRDLDLGINRSPEGFGGPSPGGANFLFADGSVRFLKDKIDPGVLKALSTPAGGEEPGHDEY
jgi:prepilin-type N-terminal cleavage/methylation domain-containing protein/prepilin-type processing-associated H-X9-DG protein